MTARNRQAAGGPVIPRKGDLDYPLWLAAIDVAIHAPRRHNSATTWAAKIPWDDIHKLRTVLESLGIDWEEAKRRDDAERARIAAERRTARPERNPEPLP
jgi:hypothetical protein